MMPKRVIERRAPSRSSRHCDLTLTMCDAPLTLRLTVSAISGYTALVLYRCETCDANRLMHHESAPALQVWGVIPEPQRARPDTTWDEDDDAADCAGGRSW